MCVGTSTTRTSYILRIFSFLLLLCRTNKLSHWFHRNNFKWPLASVINIVLKVVIGENGRIIYLAFFLLVLSVDAGVVLVRAKPELERIIFRKVRNALGNSMIMWHFLANVANSDTLLRYDWRHSRSWLYAYNLTYQTLTGGTPDDRKHTKLEYNDLMTGQEWASLWQIKKK